MTEPYDIEKFYRVMESQDSDAFTFVVQREPETGRSLSAEAVERLGEVFTAFLMARLSHSLHKRGPDGPGHREVQIDLRVSIDGKSVEVGEDDHPWYSVVDGEHRKVTH